MKKKGLIISLITGISLIGVGVVAIFKKKNKKQGEKAFSKESEYDLDSLILDADEETESPAANSIHNILSDSNKYDKAGEADGFTKADKADDFAKADKADDFSKADKADEADAFSKTDSIGYPDDYFDFFDSDDFENDTDEEDESDSKIKELRNLLM
ncbi:MAG: hypothetical protein K6E10_05135 [Eubacterium sp.]|nr:hypothetical protein [Eubacterium sp.]